MAEVDWNEYARNYDSLLALKPYTSMLDEVAQVIKFSNPNLILDAGCGTGNLLLRLNNFDVIGIDSSSEMLMRAKEKIRNLRFLLLERIELNISLPFLDRTFGAIACINSLYAVEDPGRTLAELARVILPGKPLVIVTPKQGYENGLILKAHCDSAKPDEYWKNMHTDPRREEELMREALPNEEVFLQMRTVADVNRRISQNARFHFFTRPELERLVGNAGLEVIEYRETYARQSHLIIAQLS